MKRKRNWKNFLMILAFSAAASACSRAAAPPEAYLWQRVTERAAFPAGYNYPVFVSAGVMYALNRGAWSSSDGKTWTKTDLPEIGLNPAYQRYVQFEGSVYALGTMAGDYTNMSLKSGIRRTSNFKNWETLAEKSNLPARVFYGAIVFRGKIWLFGGWDGRNYHNDVWSSADGVDWRREAAATNWSPRMVSRLIVFKDRLWLLGGGVIDGEKSDNPNSHREIWSSGDGLEWTVVETDLTELPGGSPIVFDDRLWLVGANRGDGDFSNAVYVSDDGRAWRRQSAPWSPRGGAAVWVFDGRLMLTGGKFSRNENGRPVFIYSNDVWAMSADQSFE